MTNEGLPDGQTRRTLSDGIMSFFARRPHVISSLVATAMLVGAVGSWPYWYYQLLRWIVLACATFAGVVAYKRERWWAVVVMGAVGVLFNPLVPVRLSREVWQWLDPAGAAGFASVALFIPSIKGTTRKELLVLAAAIAFAVSAGLLLAWSVGFHPGTHSHSKPKKNPTPKVKAEREPVYRAPK